MPMPDLESGGADSNGRISEECQWCGRELAAGFRISLFSEQLEFLLSAHIPS